MKGIQNVTGIEINPKFVGALFTERADNRLRVFCFLTNGGTSQFEMAADENLDNLQRFHAKLNMDETCSSVIIDEVVQGRVYVCSEENHWLYTLLSAPGNILPIFNAEICDLPWKYCWRSLAADVLEYGEPGDSDHCFAIRTQIGKNDANRLVKDSGAFTNPTYIRKKKPRRRLYFYLPVGLALTFLAVLPVLGIFHCFNQGQGEAPRPAAATSLTTESSSGGYYLLCNRQIMGPFPLNSIIRMNAGGLLSAGTMCRPENSLEWASLTALIPSQPQKPL